MKQKFFLIITAASLLLLSLASVAQALTYQEIYQYQTGGRVLGASTAVSVVQSAAGGNNFGSTKTTTAFNSPNTAGDAIVVLIQWAVNNGTANVSSVTDSNGNSYNLIPSSLETTGPTPHIANIYTEIAYATNIAGGGNNTVTVTWNQTVGGIASLLEISPSIFNQASTNTGATGNPNAGTITTAVDGTLAVATTYEDDGFGGSNVFASANGWTVFQNIGGGISDEGSQYQSQTAAGVITGKFTNGNGTWVASMAAFAPSSASASDTQAPTTPSGMVITGLSSTQVNFSWTASNDNVGVAGYNIYRDGTLVGTSNTTSYNDQGLVASTAYSYTLSAYDAAGNVSPQSQAFIVNTPSNNVGSGTNIYISQSGGVIKDGSSCANAEPVSFFNNSGNWVSTLTTGKISPGTTVHLCGLFTGAAQSTMLTFHGSGTSGNPITLLFEPNAVLTAPYWAGNPGGAIYVGANNWIVIDGGTNGQLNSTANGTGLMYQVANYGIGVGGSNVTIENMNIVNLYQRQPGGHELNDGSTVQGIAASGSANNLIIQNNTIHDVGWAITGGGDNTIIRNNIIYHADHGAALGSAHWYFYGNHVYDWSVWDSDNNAYHHDGIHCFSGSTGNTQTAYIYNNRFDGSWGNNMNQPIFLEQGDSPTKCLADGGHAVIFNNIEISDGHGVNFGLNSYNGTSVSTNGDFIANNTSIANNQGDATPQAWVIYNTPSTHCPNCGSTFYNNAISNIGSAVSAQVSPNNIMDYDAVEACSSIAGCYLGATGSNGLSTMAAWRAATLALGTTFEVHGISNEKAGPNAYFNLASGCVNGSIGANCAPQAGSPLIGAGKNLYSVCNGQPNPGLGALCFDIAGNPRPTTAAWDIGAYQYSSGGGSPPPSDTTPPSTPTGLSATAVSSSAINLSWTASTDNVGVTGYKVYRGGVQIATSATNSYSDTGLTASTQYSYTVSAYDAAGNNSSQSLLGLVTTKSAAVTLPIISNLLGQNTTATSSSISWATNVLTNGQVFYGTSSGYGLQSALLDSSPLATSHSVTLMNLSPSTLYHFKVTSIDNLSNSTSTADFSFTTLSSSSSPPSSTPVTLPSSGGGPSGLPSTAPATPVAVYIPSAPTIPNRVLSVPASGSSALRLINSSGTYYLVEDAQLHGIANPGILATYGFTFSQAKPAIAQDLALQKGNLLTPNNGALVKSAQDRTVYLISNQQRYAFTSTKVFASLGFKFSSVLLITNPELQSLPRAVDISDPQSRHLAGLDINKAGTIYWIGTDSQLHPYPSLSVYNSWHIANDFSTVLPANAADLALPVGSEDGMRILQ